jgi:8-oxo-dGTP pyrophosphatase MutT (NUDIX family)
VSLSPTQQDLLALLADLAPTAMVEQTRAFIAREPLCLERATLEGHLTTSAVVVDHGCSRVLLIHHRALGRWLQPGGHADGAVNLAASALREVVEETGLTSAHLASLRPIDVDVHAIPARGEVPEHLHYDVRFLVKADPNETLAPAEDEVHAARWFAESDLDGVTTDDSVRRLVGLAVGTSSS